MMMMFKKRIDRERAFCIMSINQHDYSFVLSTRFTSDFRMGLIQPGANENKANSKTKKRRYHFTYDCAFDINQITEKWVFLS